MTVTLVISKTCTGMKVGRHHRSPLKSSIFTVHGSVQSKYRPIKTVVIYTKYRLGEFWHILLSFANKNGMQSYFAPFRFFRSEKNILLWLKTGTQSQLSVLWSVPLQLILICNREKQHWNSFPFLRYGSGETYYLGQLSLGDNWWHETATFVTIYFEKSLSTNEHYTVTFRQICTVSKN